MQQVARTVGAPLSCTPAVSQRQTRYKEAPTAQLATPLSATTHLGARCGLGSGLSGGRRQHGGHCGQSCSCAVGGTHLQQPCQQLRLLQQALEHDVLAHAARQGLTA